MRVWGSRARRTVALLWRSAARSISAQTRAPLPGCGVDGGDERPGTFAAGFGQGVQRGDAEERAGEGERESLGGGESHAETRVGAGADVAGDQVEGLGSPVELVEERLDRRRD